MDKPSDGVPTGWEPSNEADHWMDVHRVRRAFRYAETGEHRQPPTRCGGVEFVETFGPPTRNVMALEIERIIALRLADELAESVENLETLPTREAAANLATPWWNAAHFTDS